MVILLSRSPDWTIKIWNPHDGTLKRTLNGHNGHVRSLTTLSNGDLVSGSNDRKIKIWIPNDGTLKRTLNGQTKINIEIIIATLKEYMITFTLLHQNLTYTLTSHNILSNISISL
jgi:WD40 repeat protein